MGSSLERTIPLLFRPIGLTLAPLVPACAFGVATPPCQGRRFRSDLAASPCRDHSRLQRIATLRAGAHFPTLSGQWNDLWRGTRPVLVRDRRLLRQTCTILLEGPESGLVCRWPGIRSARSTRPWSQVGKCQGGQAPEAHRPIRRRRKSVFAGAWQPRGRTRRHRGHRCEQAIPPACVRPALAPFEYRH